MADDKPKKAAAKKTPGRRITPEEAAALTAQPDPEPDTDSVDADLEALAEQLTNGDEEQPLPMVEAEDDEIGERIELVKTGWVRCHIRQATGDIVRFRLRPPLFRELKSLRTNLEEREEEIAVARQRMLGTIVDRVGQTQAANALDEPERTEALVKMIESDRKAGNDFEKLTETLRMEWLEMVFKKLGVDGSPEDWPAWAVDPNFITQITRHWQTAPLPSGS